MIIELGNIAVTEEMLTAGFKALQGFDPLNDSSLDYVEDVFREMLKASPPFYLETCPVISQAPKKILADRAKA